ncbi:unnamed protein product [Alternaria alternata]
MTADTAFNRRQVKAIAFACLLEGGVPVFFSNAQAAGVYKVLCPYLDPFLQALDAGEPQQGLCVSSGIAEWPIREDHSSTSQFDAIENGLEDKQEIELQFPVVGQVFVVVVRNMNALISTALVSPHVFVGEPAPFQWDLPVEKLIMPMNGDPNYQGPEWGQQPFPCKGHHRASTPPEPQTTWHVGSRATFQIYDSTNTTGSSMHDPGAAHSGGSCQASLSYNGGETWIVVQSWEGNCLRVRKGQEGQLTNSYDTDQSYSFDLPGSLPGADTAIFAW